MGQVFVDVSFHIILLTFFSPTLTVLSVLLSQKWLLMDLTQCSITLWNKVLLIEISFLSITVEKMVDMTPK